MAQNMRPLSVGDVIHGFAQGAFGRDHYDCVKIAWTGPDWIQAVSADGVKVTASGYQDLVFLMRVRDEEKCPHESDGGSCPAGRLIQLTDAGGFFSEPE